MALVSNATYPHQTLSSWLFAIQTLFRDRTAIAYLRYNLFVKEPTPLNAKSSKLTTNLEDLALPGNNDLTCPSWWSQGGSNSRPPACKAGALPAELWPLKLVGLGGVEPPTSPLSGVRSNQLSYRPGVLCLGLEPGNLCGGSADAFAGFA
jgi:hypothetical protein